MRDILPSPRSRRGLTVRQRETVALLAEGLTLPQVAARMGVRLSTAKGHANAAREKLGAANLHHLIALAVQAGELVLPLPRRPPIAGPDELAAPHHGISDTEMTAWRDAVTAQRRERGTS